MDLRVHMYILANPTKYTTDMDKILMVLLYIREGMVSLFAQKYYFDRELREYKAAETKKTWGTFKEFLKELAAAFKDESLEQKAQQKLFTMRMGKCSASLKLMLTASILSSPSGECTRSPSSKHILA